MNLERLGVKVEAEVGEDTREYSRRGGVGEYFQIRKGLRQGCVMSLWHFNNSFDRVVRLVNESFMEAVN